MKRNSLIIGSVSLVALAATLAVMPWNKSSVKGSYSKKGLPSLEAQTADDARKLLKNFDPKLGEPLEERSYGGSCMLYDEDSPESPWHNVVDKFDAFVPTHFFGNIAPKLQLKLIYCSKIIRN